MLFMKKIFLIDGHAQIFRMYYAFMRRPMVNSKGVDTSILFGFTKMLLELIAKEQPTHLAVAFDPPAKTFRHEAYQEYKANRSAVPELVKQALEPLQEILAAFDIPVVMMPGFEADDVIGSMATQWSGDECNIYMVTPDKDYGQLVSDTVFQYKPAKGGNDIEILGKEQICGNYGVCEPSQVIDILTIWGDASDNVPGVKGIGEVGAKKLVGKYGGLKGILEHLDELSPKQRAAFEEAGSQLDMSRFLVTIKRDIELPLVLDDILLRDFNYTKVAEVFNKYEFNSLRKLLPESVAAVAEVSGDAVQDEVKECAVTYCEGTIGQVLDMAVASSMTGVRMVEGGALVLSGRKADGEAGKEHSCNQIVVAYIADVKSLKMSDPELFKRVVEVMESDEILKVGYGFKQYIKELKLLGIDLNGCCSKGYLSGVADIGIMHYLINPERSHKEELLVKGYLDIDVEEFSNPDSAKDEPQELSVELDLFSVAQEIEEGKENEPSELDIKLCALSLPLYDKVGKALAEAGQSDLYYKMEMPLIAVLADMEWEGVKIDTQMLKEYSEELTKELDSIEMEARNMAEDGNLNLSSPKQVGIVIYEKLKLNPKVKKSAKGNYPTDEETLVELQESHPIIGKILEYRALKKLLSTYIDNLPLLINPATGKIHTTFNQTITATGRLSSTNPNLQNIPIRTERGKEIRKAFVPSDPEGYIVSADYSQIELRLMAQMSADKDLVAAFNSGEDIHTATAAKVFGVGPDEVTKEQRRRAKVANFGIIYGISAFGLSQRLGMSRSDSKALIEEYFRNYPGVKLYMNSMIEKGREVGYVETIYGRRRFLPDINSRNAAVRSFNERNAINAPLQGSAADIIKMAMINVYKRLKMDNFASRMVLQVHDELVFDVVPQERERVEAMVKEEMERVIKLSIPLVADCNGGKNWLEAH